VTRSLAIRFGIVAALTVAAAGYVAFGAIQKRMQQRHVAQVVADSTQKLKQALAPQPPAELVAALDANLQSAAAPRDRDLAEAAEHYIVGAREIARRRVESERLWGRAQASRQALANHMAAASQRGTGWLDRAVELKKRVEGDYFDLGVTLKALDQLLDGFSADEKRLAPLVPPAALLDEDIRQNARQQAQADAKRAAEELARVRNLR